MYNIYLFGKFQIVFVTTLTNVYNAELSSEKIADYLN